MSYMLMASKNQSLFTLKPFMNILKRNKKLMENESHSVHIYIDSISLLEEFVLSRACFDDHTNITLPQAVQVGPQQEASPSPT